MPFGSLTGSTGGAASLTLVSLGPSRRKSAPFIDASMLISPLARGLLCTMSSAPTALAGVFWTNALDASYRLSTSTSIDSLSISS